MFILFIDVELIFKEVLYLFMKNIELYILLIYIILFLFSCSNFKSDKENNSIYDRAGNSIIFPSKIENIASLSPSASDIILALGLADKITALDSVSKDILQTNNIDVSDKIIFDMLNPDSEKMMHINPDILFVNNFSVFSGKNSLDSIKDFGICIAVIPNSDTIKSIEEDIYFIGYVLNKNNEASNIVNMMNSNIEKIKSVGNTITKRKKVYFEIAALPNLYTFGANVYLDDMINIIGAINIFSNRNNWITASEENVLFSNPDIIFTSVQYINNPEKEILSRKYWKNINALKNNNVHYIASSSLPTHNIIYALFDMAKYVYPDEYKDIYMIGN